MLGSISDCRILMVASQKRGASFYIASWVPQRLRKLLSAHPQREALSAIPIDTDRYMSVGTIWVEDSRVMSLFRDLRAKNIEQVVGLNISLMEGVGPSTRQELVKVLLRSIEEQLFLFEYGGPSLGSWVPRRFRRRVYNNYDRLATIPVTELNKKGYLSKKTAQVFQMNQVETLADILSLQMNDIMAFKGILGFETFVVIERNMRRVFTAYLSRR